MFKLWLLILNLVKTCLFMALYIFEVWYKSNEHFTIGAYVTKIIFTVTVIDIIYHIIPIFLISFL